MLCQKREQRYVEMRVKVNSVMVLVGWRCLVDGSEFRDVGLL